ncbi:hypothetical protein FHG87_014772 [Trinorchestia longiramus]|nr:hypothetical protein FHG87_014772 [Trinorchestia longiramus]
MQASDKKREHHASTHLVLDDHIGLDATIARTSEPLQPVCEREIRGLSLMIDLAEMRHSTQSHRMAWCARDAVGPCLIATHLREQRPTGKRLSEDWMKRAHAAVIASKSARCAQRQLVRDVVCFRVRDGVCLKARDEICLKARDVVCLRDRDVVCLRVRDGVCLKARDVVCLRVRDVVCLRVRDGVCLRARDVVCLRARDVVCLRVRDGVCFRARDVVCLRARDGVCLRVRDGVCLRARDGVCFRDREAHKIQLLVTTIDFHTTQRAVPSN